MFDGSIKIVQDIKINDLIMGDNFTRRKIVRMMKCLKSSQEQEIVTFCKSSLYIKLLFIIGLCNQKKIYHRF